MEGSINKEIRLRHGHLSEDIAIKNEIIGARGVQPTLPSAVHSTSEQGGHGPSVQAANTSFSEQLLATVYGASILGRSFAVHLNLMDVTDGQ